MRRVQLLTGLSFVLACNGGGGEGREDGNGEGTSGVLTITASSTAGDGQATEGQDSAQGTGNGSSNGQDGPDPDGGSGDGNDAKFDVGSPDGGASCGGGLGGGDGTHSYIWIANSPQGTVSKINTQTMIEEGRYIVRPDAAGNPSRTSVALSGNVAVANRYGGVVKIYVNVEDCQEKNGVPGIQTATDANFLPWDQEECVAWFTALNYASNRPVAWAQGELNEDTCKYENEKLWTAGSNGAGTAQVLLLDGETGIPEAQINVPELQHVYGLYGGAVDGDGNFWGIETGGPRLVRVDRQTFTYQIWNGPGVASYGIAVDSVGRPWFCAGGGASRFDPIAQTWQTLPSPGGNQWGGCMTDGAGTLWHCRQQDAMLVGIDTETLTVVQQIQLPAYSHGISIDFDGYVWAVGFTSTNAYRVDPVTATIDTFTGLVGAYTYSDMTGFGLSSAGTPSG